MPFTELRVGAFRALVDVTLPLRPLNVIIGPNGAGKTSLLETFLFLQLSVTEKIQEAVLQFGGIDSLIPAFHDSARVVDLGLSISLPYLPKTLLVKTKERTNAQYHFILSGMNNGRYETTIEQFSPNFGEPHQDTINLADDSLTRLSNATASKYKPYLDLFREHIRPVRLSRPMNVFRNTPVRIPQTLVPTTDPSANGETLFAALYNLRENHPHQFEYIKDVLRTAFPSFQDLLLPVVGAGLVTLGWKQTELTRILYPNELSEGTLRFLWLVTLLLSPEPAPLTLIDEPEASLHPELLQLLAGLLQTAALRGQVIVATQSADLIRWLDPADIVIADKEEGKVRFTRGDEIPVIEEWIQEYTLGDLWRMGVLGGRE